MTRPLAVPPPSAASAAGGLASGVLGDVLKQKLLEANELVSWQLKAFAFFLTITGALLKFALDKSSTHQLTIALSTMGIVTTAIAVVAAYFSSRIRRHLSADISAVNGLLGLPNLGSTLRPAMYVEVICVAFAGAVLLGWLVVLLTSV